MSIQFISDLHLSEERPHTVAAFFCFLERVKGECESLYILGDFFDAWIGDDDDRPLVADVAAALFMLSQREGVRIFFQHGNRDFLLGEDFAVRSGMTLLPELQVITLPSGQRCLLAHGDQFCTADTAYQHFRATVREPDWQRAFLTKPLAERRAIAADLRARSREANSIKQEDIMDVTQDVVISVMQEQQVSVLLHGHTHRPSRHPVRLANGLVGERVVLGEWDTSLWVATATAKGLSLDQCPL